MRRHVRHLVFLLALIVTAPAAAEWRRAESPNFVLYGEQSESALRQRILLLEDFDRLLRTITNVNAPPSPNRLHVYILAGPRQLRAIRDIPPGVIGLYTATAEGIGAFIDGSAEMANQILLHEYAHHFMRQYSPTAYPAWYAEGFADYFMTVRFAARGIDVGDVSPGRAASIVSGTWLPMARILSGTPMDLNREQIAQYYAQSWLLTHYFYSTAERQAVLNRYLTEARRSDPVAALETTAGFAPDRLETELRNYIRGGSIRFRRVPRGDAAAPPAVTVTALSPGADAVIADAAALRIGVEEANRPALLARLRTAAARFPNDPFVARTLAHAEAVYGDSAAADRPLDTMLAASPNDAELMYLRGRRHLAAAEQGGAPPEAMRAARTWFSRAHRADGNHFQTLYRYAQSLRGDDNYVSENTSNILVLAHQLAPQVHEITMNAAWLLLQRGARAQAAALVEPLAGDPHNPGLARAAAQLLARARGEPAPFRERPAPMPDRNQPLPAASGSQNRLFPTPPSR
ncbi:tetratricopeptide repeat protein [Sphingosinicella sp.]|uniref:tetratricopeptide repeat protein n=1 Tax=Sphingosinicella sp. TaxID=1917971 RepID=UPI0040382031